MSILTQNIPAVNDEEEIPFYNESEITRHATTEPIDDYIGEMLRRAQRPTPLEEVAEHIFNEVWEATADLFAAWEAMDEVFTAGAEEKRNGNGVDYEAAIRAEEPWVDEPRQPFFEDEVTA